MGSLKAPIHTFALEITTNNLDIDNYNFIIGNLNYLKYLKNKN